jgi:hypothetical protein
MLSGQQSRTLYLVENENSRSSKPKPAVVIGAIYRFQLLLKTGFFVYHPFSPNDCLTMSQTLHPHRMMHCDQQNGDQLLQH